MHEPATTVPTLAWSRTYPASAHRVRDARKFLAGVLAGRLVANDAVLCLSELAANAVLHSNSRQPGGVFTVRAQVRDRVRVEVEDQGGFWAQPVNADGQRGRGLLIVGNLASDWGITGDSDTAWTVWFEMDCP
jgi:serine/threonine-protein kinase RsbW